MRKNYGGVLLLVKLQAKATLLKVTLLHECFSRYLNCTNATKSRKAPHNFPSYWDCSASESETETLTILKTHMEVSTQYGRPEN